MDSMLSGSETTSEVGSSILEDEDEGTSQGDGSATPMARVTFARDDQVKIMTPMHTQSSFGHEPNSPSSDSGASTPASEDSLTNSPIAKTLATRLSFWTRLSKRTTGPISPSPDDSLTERTSIDSLINTQSTSNVNSNLGPTIRAGASEVISSILAATAPPPVSAEERKSELEDKIVKECVKEFTKGGMYFAYNFGVFLSITCQSLY